MYREYNPTWRLKPFYENKHISAYDNTVVLNIKLRLN